MVETLSVSQALHQRASLEPEENPSQYYNLLFRKRVILPVRIILNRTTRIVVVGLFHAEGL